MKFYLVFYYICSVTLFVTWGYSLTFYRRHNSFDDIEIESFGQIKLNSGNLPNCAAQCFKIGCMAFGLNGVSGQYVSSSIIDFINEHYSTGLQSSPATTQDPYQDVTIINCAHGSACDSCEKYKKASVFGITVCCSPDCYKNVHASASQIKGRITITCTCVEGIVG